MEAASIYWGIAGEGWLGRMDEVATFLRLTAEGWVAIATFIGAGAVLLSGLAVLGGVYYGAKQYLNEQEARDVRRYYIDDGLWALSGTLDQLLQVVRQNHAAILSLAGLIKAAPAGDAYAPKMEDLPRLATANFEQLSVRGMRPSSAILGLGKLAKSSDASKPMMKFDHLLTQGLARLFGTHLKFTQMELAVRSYYALGQEDAGLADRLLKLSEKPYYDAEKYQHVTRVLEFAGLRLQKLRVSSFSQIEQIASDDGEIADLKNQLRELWDKVQASKAKDDSKPSEAEDDDEEAVTES